VRVAIVGVGLIGGSVGMAARRRLGAEVLGVDRDPAVLERAVQRGAIDAAARELPGDVDLAVVCVGVGDLAQVIATTAGALPDAIVTDVGSVKRGLDGDPPWPNYIGGHPLAGGESAGVEHSREDLFDGATWYLTPRVGTEGVRFERLHRFVAGLGARPAAIEAADHDRIMAAVSHLPHVLANVLVAQAAAALDGERMPATGPSFRDATRVAGSNPPLWGEIYAANRDALLAQVDGAMEHLAELRTRLAAGGSLETWQREARDRRQALLETGLAGGDLAEVRVGVPNRPGVIAELALALGRAGVNIFDMSLSPSPDNQTGVVAFWVAAGEAARVQELIG
jgi:prephenate dehydrogenase